MSSKVLKKIAMLEDRLKRLEEVLMIKSVGPTPKKSGPEAANVLPGHTVSSLLDIPDSLRRTILAVEELGEANAPEVAVKTGRTRGIETIYLNHLTRMGYLSRFKRGRKIYFKPLRFY